MAFPAESRQVWPADSGRHSDEGEAMFIELDDGRIYRKLPYFTIFQHISWENLWFPVEIFPSTHPLTCAFWDQSLEILGEREKPGPYEIIHAN